MAAHRLLKNEFTEDVKCHNLMSWLDYWFKRKDFVEILEGSISTDVDENVPIKRGMKICFM